MTSDRERGQKTVPFEVGLRAPDLAALPPSNPTPEDAANGKPWSFVHCLGAVGSSAQETVPVFGGIRMGFSNARTPLSELNALPVPLDWVGERLVATLMAEIYDATAGLDGGSSAWHSDGDDAYLDDGWVVLPGSESSRSDSRLGMVLDNVSDELESVELTFDSFPAGVTLDISPLSENHHVSLHFEGGGVVTGTVYDARQADPISIGTVFTRIDMTSLQLYSDSTRWVFCVNGQPVGDGHFAVPGKLNDVRILLRLAPTPRTVKTVRVRSRFAGKVLSVSERQIMTDLLKRAAAWEKAGSGRSKESRGEDSRTYDAEAETGYERLIRLTPQAKTERPDRDLLRMHYQKALDSTNAMESLTVLYEWWQSYPDDAEPLERIALQLEESGYEAESLCFFMECLDKEPARLDMAIRAAALYSRLQRMEEARLLLNRYAVLYPESVDILFAQANWLRAQGRRREVVEHSRRILKIEPNNVDALVYITENAERPEERQNALNALAQLMPQHTNSISAYLNMLDERRLLTLPGAGVVWDAIIDVALKLDRPDIKATCEQLTPKPLAVDSPMDPEAILSDWAVEGSRVEGTAAGEISLQGNPGQPATLFARHSQQWSDGFIEVESQQLSEGFWLMARDSVNGVVRFGFDRQDGRIYLQHWHDGRNALQRSMQFELAPDFFESSHRYRLECRGAGARAFIDGKPVSSTVLDIDGAWDVGRFGISFHNGNPATNVVLTKLAAASLAPRVVLAHLDTSEPRGEQMQSVVEMVRSSGTILSKPLFSVSETGELVSKDVDVEDIVPLIAKYHKVRYMPGVECTNSVLPEAAVLAELADINGYDGLVLHAQTLPGADWWRSAREMLILNGVGLFVMVEDESGNRVECMSNCMPTFEAEPFEAKLLRTATRMDELAPLTPVVYRFE